MLCFALLSIVFCLNVNAEEVDSKTVKVNIYSYDNTLGGFGQIDLLNGENNTKGTGMDDSFSYSKTTSVDIRTRFTFVDTTGKPLMKKDVPTKFFVDNIYLVNFVDGLNQTSNNNLFNARLEYVDGSTLNVTSSCTLTYNDNASRYSISLSATPTKDVARIYIYTSQTYSGKTTITSGASQPYVLNTFGGTPITITIDRQSEEAGLLSGLIGWVTNIFNKIGSIFDKITEGFSSMAQGFTNLLQSLTELPSKLWNLISDGLKALFVPSQNKIQQLKNDFDIMLSQKLGAVYEVLDITTNSWENIKTNDENNTITIPRLHQY